MKFRKIKKLRKVSIPWIRGILSKKDFLFFHFHKRAKRKFIQIVKAWNILRSAYKNRSGFKEICLFIRIKKRKIYIL